LFPCTAALAKGNNAPVALHQQRASALGIAAKEAKTTVSAEANVNLDNGTKKDDEHNKATLATNQQAPKETAQVGEEQSMVKDVSSSRNGKKKKKTAEFDEQKFAQELLAEINLFRGNPKQYAEKIRTHMAYIKKDKDKLIYQNGEVKTVLNKGQDAFNSCVDILLNLSPLANSLELSDDVKIEVPDDVELQTKSFNSLQTQFKAKYPGKKLGFNLDLGAPNPEALVVMQLVDDNKNNGLRRNNILDNGFRHLGVSIKKGKAKHYAIYLTFSD